jgi:CheY-like chemotaxis protein
LREHREAHSIKTEIIVLVVDDNSTFREAFQDLLRLLYPTWSVLGASSGFEALEVAKTKQPSLIFLDFHMPGMNGFEVALALREMVETSLIPLVLISSEEGDHPIVRHLIAMCQAILRKPFTLYELEQALGRLHHATPSLPLIPLPLA